MERLKLENMFALSKFDCDRMKGMWLLTLKHTHRADNKKTRHLKLYLYVRIIVGDTNKDIKPHFDNILKHNILFFSIIIIIIIISSSRNIIIGLIVFFVFIFVVVCQVGLTF